jgi:hypothetical protein
MNDPLHVDKVTTSSTYQVDGKTYASLDEMPPDVRKKVEGVLADRNSNGIPDIMEDFMAPTIGAAALAGAKAQGADAASSFERSALAASAAQAKAAAAASDIDRIRRRQMVVTAAVTVGLVAIGIVIWLLVKK